MFFLFGRSSSGRVRQTAVMAVSTSIVSFVSVSSTTTSCEDKKEKWPPNYPNFTRHGSKSLLAKHLTPEIYQKLSTKQSKLGTRLDDIIGAGVSLPYGAHPPRGMGVYVGDADCYKTFAPLLHPMMEEYHGVKLVKKPGTSIFGGGRSSGSHSNRAISWWWKWSDERITGLSPRATKLRKGGGRKLQRQVTNLNPNQVLHQNIDPTGEYILYTRLRLSRSLDGWRFAACMSRQERRDLQEILGRCVKSHFPEGTFRSIMDLTNAEHYDLLHRHILSPTPDAYTLSAGLGRDWPDGRGVYLDSWESPSIIIRCNDTDHFRIVAVEKGGSLKHVFTRLTEATNRLEEALREHKCYFAQDDNLGFLNSSPVNCGTALRASVFVKLVRLGQQPGFKALLDRLRLEASTRFQRTRSEDEEGSSSSNYTGIFDIANAERWGYSEVELINTMIQGVGRLIALEKRLERGETINLDEIA